MIPTGPHKLKRRSLIHFMYYFMRGEKCHKCGSDPIYMINRQPFCYRCVEEIYLESEHDGMIYNPYTERWSWI